MRHTPNWLVLWRFLFTLPTWICTGFLVLVDVTFGWFLNNQPSWPNSQSLKKPTHRETFLHQDRHALASAVELVGGQHRIGDILVASPKLGISYHGGFRLELLKFRGAFVVFIRWFIWIPALWHLGFLKRRGTTRPHRNHCLGYRSCRHLLKLTTQYAASFETPSRELSVRVWVQTESWISSLGSSCLVVSKFLTPLFQVNIITLERPFELMVMASTIFLHAVSPRFTAAFAAFKY